MIEIRFHGRGGQGAVVASRLLGRAAFLEGKSISSFPFFGVERRGAPVTAFTKIDERPIRIKSQIYEPHYVIVMDPSLLKAIDVTAGLRPGGGILVNTVKDAEDIRSELNVDNAMVATIDATGIATEHGLGSRMAPIVNTSIIGAFAAFSKVVKLESVLKAIEMDVPRKREDNMAAAEDAYHKLRTGGDNA